MDRIKRDHGIPLGRLSKTRLYERMFECQENLKRSASGSPGLADRSRQLCLTRDAFVL